jgi:hypothetical protein
MSGTTNPGRLLRYLSSVPDFQRIALSSSTRKTLTGSSPPSRTIACSSSIFADALDGTKSEIESLERALIAAAPPECCSWNANTGIRYPEPVGLVDELMEALQFSESQRAAVERQAGLFHSDGMTAA